MHRCTCKSLPSSPATLGVRTHRPTRRRSPHDQRARRQGARSRCAWRPATWPIGRICGAPLRSEFEPSVAPDSKLAPSRENPARPAKARVRSVSSRIVSYRCIASDQGKGGRADTTRHGPIRLFRSEKRKVPGSTPGSTTPTTTPISPAQGRLSARVGAELTDLPVPSAPTPGGRSRSRNDRYRHAMATTMQVSENSRDRLRALGRQGATLEETLVEALDAVEREQFWAAAEPAEARRRRHVGRRAGCRHGCRSRRPALARRLVTPSAGDIFLANARDEQRRRVLVVSDARFHRSTRRAIVAPSITTITADESPWRPGVEERFAVDFLTTLPLDRLLEAVGLVDAATLRQAQRAIVSRCDVQAEVAPSVDERAGLILVVPWWRRAVPMMAARVVRSRGQPATIPHAAEPGSVPFHGERGRVRRFDSRAPRARPR